MFKSCFSFKIQNNLESDFFFIQVQLFDSKVMFSFGFNLNTQLLAPAKIKNIFNCNMWACKISKFMFSIALCFQSKHSFLSACLDQKLFLIVICGLVKSVKSIRSLFSFAFNLNSRFLALA